MKLSMKMLFIVILLSQATSAFAAKDKAAKKVDAKCYIEIVGGGSMISFWTTTAKKLSSLPNKIVGTKVTKLGSKQKVAVYKVFECVLSQDKFKSAVARALDEKTPR